MLKLHLLQKASPLMKTSDRKPQPFTPLTGESCSCRRGVERDNCPACEGTGNRIDFAAIHREQGQEESPSAYVRRMRAAFGEDLQLLRRRIEPGGVVFIITKHVTRSGARVFLPVVFYRHQAAEQSPLDSVPARDAFRIGKTECVALGWRWDKKHLGWVEEVGGGHTAMMAIRELSRVLFNDPSSLVAVEV